MKQIVIEAHYYDLLEEYLKENPGSNEYEMVKNEIDFYEDFIEKFIKESYNVLYSNKEDKEKQLIEYKKYLNYFKDKIRTLVKPKEDNLDISNDKTFNIEKVAWLIQLGVVDFLKEKFPQIDDSKLSQLINSFTGIKAKTVYRNLNDYKTKKNTGIEQKNNPITETRIKKINQTLINLGLIDLDNKY